jgi:hypothetical protein
MIIVHLYLKKVDNTVEEETEESSAVDDLVQRDFV